MRQKRDNYIICHTQKLYNPGLCKWASGLLDSPQLGHLKIISVKETKKNNQRRTFLSSLFLLFMF